MTNAEPQDAEFGRKAKEKEEQLDEALEAGKPVPAEPPPADQPHPGSKA